MKTKLETTIENLQKLGITDYTIKKGLVSIGGYADFRNAQGIELPALTSIGCFAHGNSETKAINMPIITKGLDIHIFDGYMHIINSTKKIGGVLLHDCDFLGRDNAANKRVFVAEFKGLYAHGANAKEALIDLKYKLELNREKIAVVAEIKETGFVTVEQYRALTGACKLGVNSFLEEMNIKEDKLPLDKVLEITKGRYGYETFCKILK